MTRIPDKNIKINELIKKSVGMHFSEFRDHLAVIGVLDDCRDLQVLNTFIHLKRLHEQTDNTNKIKQELAHYKFIVTYVEVDTLKCMLNGYTYEKIAQVPGIMIGESGIRKRIRRIYNKLGVNNKAEAIKKAKDEGFSSN